MPVPVYEFRVRLAKADAGHPLACDALSRASERLPAQYRIDTGSTMTLIGRCEAESQGAARTRVESKLAEAAPHMPRLTVVGLRLLK